VAPVCLEANAQCPFDDPATRLERLNERETACHRKVRNSVSLTAAIVPPAAAAADADVGVASGVRGSHDPQNPRIISTNDRSETYCTLKAKFHYAIWFEAGRRQARSWSVTSFEPVCDQLRTSFEPDSVMEFGRGPASSC